jgi:hypothetical protein
MSVQAMLSQEFIVRALHHAGSANDNFCAPLKIFAHPFRKWKQGIPRDFLGRVVLNPVCKIKRAIGKRALTVS